MSVSFPASISRLTGVYLNWRGPDLLALESTKKLRLSAFPGLSVVLPLVSNSATASSQKIFQERGISTQGEFTVVAPDNYGILAVIQELKFRLNEKKDSRAKNVTRSNKGIWIKCSICSFPEVPQIGSKKLITHSFFQTSVKKHQKLTPLTLEPTFAGTTSNSQSPQCLTTQ